MEYVHNLKQTVVYVGHVHNIKHGACMWDMLVTTLLQNSAALYLPHLFCLQNPLGHIMRRILAGTVVHFLKVGAGTQVHLPKTGARLGLRTTLLAIQPKFSIPSKVASCHLPWQFLPSIWHSMDISFVSSFESL